MEPGSVLEKFYYGADFPRGHIVIKNFMAEVVDEKGNSVPLHETYLHHWLIERYYQPKGEKISKPHVDPQSNILRVKNSGLCDNGLSQYFGLGSETRTTATYVPDPYGIVVGDPADVPDGYEEQWRLVVHAINTRGAEDKSGCIECRCDLYNTSLDGYNGGLRCCHDQARCRLNKGFKAVNRGLYLKYTVKYVEWDASIIPVEIYIIDVTDTWRKKNESNGLTARHECLIEYEVESCHVSTANDACIHSRSVSVSLPTGGDVVYGVAHQHSGGVGSTLYGEGGRVICSSYPTYGTGNEAGNGAGYIVGMSTGYPAPGSVTISAGETLTLVSDYSSKHRHTGVMGLFYLLLKMN